ncbi:MAG: DNA translocase FtsK [Acidobacteria bacterium]|nr:DNA translocase FtsK [Acidobacteriota bacterium]
MTLLKPTANRRWNELIGLIWMGLALMVFLGLVSFSSSDRSFHTASASLTASNWVGTVGAYSADLFYQLFGISAFLLPLLMGCIGWQLLRSRPAVSHWSKLAGVGLFFLSFPSALALIPYPLRLYGLFPIGGALGWLLAEGLRAWLNGPGSAIFVALMLTISVYILTAFSVERTSEWIKARMGWFTPLTTRWTNWRAARAARRNARQIAKQKSHTPAVERIPTPTGPVLMPQFAAAKPAESRMISAPPQGPVDIPVQVPVSPSAPPKTRRMPMTATPLSPRISQAYKLPSTALLLPADGPQPHAIEDLKRMAAILTSKCEEFDVHGTVTQINPGPVVTTYEYKPEAGVKYNRITNLVDDLCLALEAESILIERIPGKSTVGIEVPNPQRETIVLREILESESFCAPRSPLTVALGKEINGRIRVADLASMPHLLIAGSTGSGKSVTINNLLISILYKATPDDVKLILVDPKRLELGLYEGIPHLVTPIITDPKVAANALRNGVKEMERRLKLLAEKGVRNIEQYNKLFDKPESLNLFEPQNEHQRLPYILICIDELADLMMVDSNSVEYSITRLAQMARAVGIHLVLATQRPSVDVITGLIKANFPARISFRVATKVDSRTILDTNGAEALLGKGDMLFSPPGSGRLVRVHGSLVTEAEICQVVDFWRSQAAPSYVEEFLKPAPTEEAEDSGVSSGADEDATESGQDDMYDEAVRVVVEMGKASTSILQRRLRLGYGRAARLLDIMEKDGIIGPPDGSRPREVLKRPDWFAEIEGSRTEA